MAKTWYIVMAIRILKKSFIQTKNTYHKGGKKIDKNLLENNPTAIGVLYFFMLL